MADHTTSDFLETAIAAAKDAEAIIKHYFDDSGQTYAKKGDGSPVTGADQEAEEAIITRIKASFPNHSIFGEESGRDTKDSEYMWVIDPIDGTKSFTRGIPLVGTLIALFKDDEVIVAVSNMPLLGDIMCAEKGKGAFANGEPIQCSAVESLSDAYVVTGSLHYFSDRGLTDNLVRLNKQSYQLRGIGDVYMYHLLAQGKVDAVVEAKTKIWDIAPLMLIVQEAGGMVTELDGSKMSMDSTDIVASNTKVHQQAVNTLNEGRDNK